MRITTLTPAKIGLAWLPALLTGFFLLTATGFPAEAPAPGTPPGGGEGSTRSKTDRDLERLRASVQTENPQLNAIAEKIFQQCIFSKLFDPRPPALPHRWFSPGGGYVGQWIWDTMFVLIAYAPLGDDEIIRGVFDNYWQTIERNPEAPRGTDRYGMVPNFLKDWPPLGYSQIPILAWGCWMVYQQNHDRRLLEQSLPYLLAFDHWYATERDVDQDGLIEFGAYKTVGQADLIQTARYETFDYHPPMDDMQLTRHPRREGGGAWYGNVEGVDQTCFLLMSERALVQIARELGQAELADRLERTVTRRIEALQTKMWDETSSFFYSLNRDTDTRIPVRTIQGFLTLACDAATPNQAQILARQLEDPKQWWCAYPVPTVALNDPKFDPKGFWRGDMWPVTTYLVAYGLNRYGLREPARKLTTKMVELFAKHGVNERYDGTTGQPLGVQGLGMSCAVWSMIVQNLYGVDCDFRTIQVPPEAVGRRLQLGPLSVAYPETNTLTLQTSFERPFTVVLPQARAGRDFTVACDGEALPAVEIEAKPNRVSFQAKPGRRYAVRWD